MHVCLQTEFHPVGYLLCVIRLILLSLALCLCGLIRDSLFSHNKISLMDYINNVMLNIQF